MTVSLHGLSIYIYDRTITLKGYLVVWPEVLANSTYIDRAFACQKILASSINTNLLPFKYAGFSVKHNYYTTYINFLAEHCTIGIAYILYFIMGITFA